MLWLTRRTRTGMVRPKDKNKLSMAYRFKLKEPIRKGVRRIGVAQIDRAIKSLATGRDQNAEIHDARKAIKRTRALLRLVKPSLSKRNFDIHNSALRELAASLSGPRDRHVMIETVQKLYASAGQPAEFPLKELLGHFAANGDDALAEPETIQAVIAGLGEQRDGFEALDCEGQGFDVIEEGLAAGYKFGREALDIAYAGDGGHDETFHDLRKGLQLHWRHMALLSRCWPQYFDVRISAARELSQILGDEHDLSVLIQAVGPLNKPPFGNAGLVAGLAVERRAALRDAAQARAARLYAERPKDFVQRIRSYWEIAPKLAEIPEEPHDLEAMAEAEPAATKPRSRGQRTSRAAR